jgi:hypothetical protein
MKLKRNHKFEELEIGLTFVKFVDKCPPKGNQNYLQLLMQINEDLQFIHQFEL